MACDVPSGYELQSTTNVDRYGTLGPYHPRPCWTASVYECVTGEDSIAPPPGPFFQPADRIVAANASSLAADWLSDANLHQQSTARNGYRLIIPDYRAWIRTIEADGQHLSVVLGGHCNDELSVAAVRMGFRGETEKVVAAVRDRRGDLQFNGSVRDLDLWVFSNDGNWLDHYHEDAHRVSWGGSLYNRPPDQRKEFADLEAALEAGENEHAEFKPWLSVTQRDNKSAELLSAVCSFANGAGGAVFIGVSDSGEVIGTDRALREAYAPTEKRPLEQLRDAYARDVKKFLNEGVRPSVNPDLEWIETAGLTVLKVTIRQGTERPYSLVETGDIYVRRGATSRKARASDYLESLGRAF